MPVQDLVIVQLLTNSQTHLLLTTKYSNPLADLTRTLIVDAQSVRDCPLFLLNWYMLVQSHNTQKDRPVQTREPCLHLDTVAIKKPQFLKYLILGGNIYIFEVLWLLKYHGWIRVDLVSMFFYRRFMKITMTVMWILRIMIVLW